MKIKTKSGFTLIELLVCMAIAGILGAIIMAAIGSDHNQPHHPGKKPVKHKWVEAKHTTQGVYYYNDPTNNLLWWYLVMGNSGGTTTNVWVSSPQTPAERGYTPDPQADVASPMSVPTTTIAGETQPAVAEVQSPAEAQAEAAQEAQAISDMIAEGNPNNQESAAETTSETAADTSSASSSDSGSSSSGDSGGGGGDSGGGGGE